MQRIKGRNGGNNAERRTQKTSFRDAREEGEKIG